MKKRFRKLCALTLIVAGMASGCVATRNAGASLDGLSAAHAADARALAEISADQLAERHAPAHTALALSRADGAFGEAFEKALRLKGFAIVPPDYGGSSLGVRYHLGALEGSGPAVGYAQISMSDGRVFSVSRMLGEESPPAYTEPPAKPAPSRELESRPLPESPAPVKPASVKAEAPKQEDSPAPSVTPAAKRYPVRKTATAAAVARRSGVNVDDFCKWNGVGRLATLPKGMLVYLSEPPAGTIVAGPDVPVPPKAAEVQRAEKAEDRSAPVVASTLPTKEQTTHALTPPAVSVADSAREKKRPSDGINATGHRCTLCNAITEKAGNFPAFFCRMSLHPLYMVTLGALLPNSAVRKPARWPAVLLSAIRYLPSGQSVPFRAWAETVRGSGFGQPASP